MKTSIVSIFICLLLTAGLASCAKDGLETPVSGERVAAQFQVGISTRAHDGVWDANDDVGLTMVEQNTTRIIGDVYNYDYYTPGSTNIGFFQPRAQGKTIYFPDDGSRVNFKGYYPYAPALARDMLLPLHVGNQTALPQIDLMTAEHISGFSKTDKEVHLNFHHRLSKVIFKLAQEPGQAAIALETISLTIKGMKTAGTYDLLNETLTADDSSVADISIPYRNDPADRYGIVLPRPAGSGITFEFTTPQGGKYTAAMVDDMELKAGYQYTFYVTLKETAVVITAEIEPWIDGRTTYYDALNIGTPAGESVGAVEGDVMSVYQQGTGNAFSLLRDYTYGADGRWTPDTPVYWEDITAGNEATFRASLEREAALNGTQMPDVLVSDEVTAAKNTGVDFTLKRAVTKVFVELHSNTFTEDQLEGATIVLPNYLVGGTVVNGAYIAPTGTRSDIEVDRTDVQRGVAVFDPQTVSPGGDVITVTIGSNSYTAQAGVAGMNFEAGVANTLVVNLDEGSVSVSARIVDWVEGTPSQLGVVQFGTPAGASENVTAGTQMEVFLQDENNNAFPKYSFTYGTDGIWRTTPPIYWENLSGEGPYTARGWIIANATPANNTQLPDYLIADPVTVNKFDGANFTLTHAASQVVVSLTSSTFTPQELASATVTLPGYKTGGTFANGVFTPGNTTTEVIPVKQSSGVWTALIQPQVITAGNTVVKIVLNSRTYEAKAKIDFTYSKGEIMRITVNMDENILTISAKANEWTTTDANLNVMAPSVSIGTNEDIQDQERMEIYYTDGTGASQTAVYTYTASTDQWSSSAPIFWDDIQAGSQLRATLFRQETPYNSTQVADQMVLVNPVTITGDAAVHFDFIHPAARVIVAVDGGTDFTPAEVAAMEITLPGYTRGGSVTRGVFTPGTQVNNTITVQKNVGENNAQAIAIIDAQTISQGQTVVRLTSQTGVVYNATYSSNIRFAPGESTVLNISLRKTGLSLSATAADWDDQTPLNLVPQAITVGGSLAGTDAFFQNKTIYLYKWGTGYWQDTYTYLAGVWSGTRRYWDDQAMPFSITGIYYPLESTTPTINSGTTSFPWNLPANQETTDGVTAGYTHYDILTDHLQLPSPQYLNFEFVHALTKVTIVLTSDEFTVPEMQGAQIRLNNVVIDGNIQLPAGTASAAAGATPKTVTPWTETDGVQYSALAMPQTIPTGTELVTVTLAQYPNTPFHGILSPGLTLVAGQNHVITLKLRRTSIDLSATVKPWGTGDPGEIIIQ